MNANQVIERIQERREQLDVFGVRSLALFGSVARAEERADSDIDLLVTFEGPATFDQYIDLKLLLEELLGRRIAAFRDVLAHRYLGAVDLSYSPLLRPGL